MHFTRRTAMVLIVIMTLSTLGCNTISHTKMASLGDDDAGPNVTGRGTHTTYAGLGTTGAGYARVYEEARAEAAAEAQERLDIDQPPVLYNVKVFRENKAWPQILSVVLGAVGSGIIALGVETGGPSEDYDEGNWDSYEEYEEDASYEPNYGLIGLGSVLNVAAVAIAPIFQYDMWVIADYGPADEE